MGKIYSALGLMSGTSMDGVDASIIQSDGEDDFKAVSNNYFQYNEDLFKKLNNLRDRINRSKDIANLFDEIKLIEKEITLFHGQVSIELIQKTGIEVDLIGFHGQTIFHNVEEKITKQIGDANLLSQLSFTA